MEFADQGLMAPLTRQLGMVLRIVRRQQQQQQQGVGVGGVWMLQEDKECAQLLGKPVLKSTCRFTLDDGGVLQVLGEDEQGQGR